MNTRLAAASLVSVFWLIAEAGQEAAGFAGLVCTVACQTVIDVSNTVKAKKPR